MLHNFFTNRHNRYWSNRQIDWRQAYWNPEHPHRDLIVKALSNIKFGSIIEIGCASGANLGRIKQAFPHVQIGGIDVSEDAIKTALEIFGDKADVLEVGNATKIFLSDKSTDVVLTDAVMIYIDPFDINKAIKEIKRVTRKNVLFVELHSKSWWERLAIRLFSGYNLYNWPKLLEQHGFYNIEILKIPEHIWPGIPWARWGHVISARL